MGSNSGRVSMNLLRVIWLDHQMNLNIKETINASDIIAET
jgi:hypothetical protein